VVHGDLKPENALMGAAGRVALSDFGCSKVLADSEAEFDRCNGTPAFLAPEMMRPNARYRGRPADVYALGACLFSFVFGCIPFRQGSPLCRASLH
jgi:[calcium/calmodulin-dependent protein kinase] kinase